MTVVVPVFFNDMEIMFGLPSLKATFVIVTDTVPMNDTKVEENIVENFYLLK